MLALSTMSSGAQAVFFAIALIAFIVAGVLTGIARDAVRTLFFIGASAFVLVFFWNALAGA